MSKELVISANRHETKVAILEDDQLVEIYFQRGTEYSLAGSIHKGRVTRVLPGMQSAFVDLGLERDTFLYVSDFFEENEEFDRILPAKEDRPARTERAPRVEYTERAEKALAEPPAERFTADVVAALEAEAGMEASPTESALVSPPVVAGAEATGTSDEKKEQGDERDRRARRSRRRRNRGRGFPDSKYASELSDAPAGEISGEPAVQLERPVVTSVLDAFEFPVLPGESLAKYRHPSTPVEDEPAPMAAKVTWVETIERETEAEALEAFEGHALESTGAARAREVEKAAPAAAEMKPEQEQEPVVHWMNLHPHVADPEPELEPEAEAISNIIEERREGGPVDLEDAVESPQKALEITGSHEVSTGPAGGLELDVSDVEIAEEIEDVDETEEGDVTPLVAALPDEATAQVRGGDQGGRYQQRSGRRTRRKGRGGQQHGGGAPQAGSAQDASLTGQPRPERVERTERPQRSESNRGESPRTEGERSESRPSTRTEKAPLPLITDLLKEGQEIIVQIAKEPLGQKGARITSHIALPGRYVVYMPTLEHMGVSRKIASDEERLRLKKILQAHHAGIQGGFIVRTAGEGKTEDEIAADMTFLGNLWLDIKVKSERKPAPLLLHHDLDIVQRVLRDQITESFKSIWVDSEEAYESILRFVQRFQPALVTRVKMYTRQAPIFDAFSITQELEKALRPKVWLKSGGYIVINQTEALVAIDVNTGKYVGKSNRLEDTIVKTNTEAVNEIVRQIRLRDLGGIIVVDFIDMDERKNRQKVMQVLEEAMRVDKAPYKILQFNDFGLVAITRKRVKQSLERALCSPCPYCEGAGSVKSVQTTVSDILQEAHKIARAVDGKDVMLRVHPEVAKFLKSNQNKYLEEMEEVLRRPVLVKSDPSLHQEKFDLA